jgi:hypothetical protein
LVRIEKPLGEALCIPVTLRLPPSYPADQSSVAQDATATIGPVDEVGLPLDVPRIMMCSTVQLRDVCVRRTGKVFA